MSPPILLHNSFHAFDRAYLTVITMSLQQNLLSTTSHSPVYCFCLKSHSHSTLYETAFGQYLIQHITIYQKRLSTKVLPHLPVCVASLRWDTSPRLMLHLTLAKIPSRDKTSNLSMLPLGKLHSQHTVDDLQARSENSIPGLIRHNPSTLHVRKTYVCHLKNLIERNWISDGRKSCVTGRSTVIQRYSDVIISYFVLKFEQLDASWSL